MRRAFDGNDQGLSDSFIDTLSDSFMAAMCEMLVALAIAAAICVGVVSLSAHLIETRTARASSAGALPRAALPVPGQPSVAMDLN